MKNYINLIKPSRQMICGGFSKASCKTSPLNELWIEQPWHDSEKFWCQSIQSQINLYIFGRKYHCISCSLFTFFYLSQHTIDCMLQYAYPHPGTCDCTCILYCNQHNCNMNYIIIRTAVAEEEITTLPRATSNFQPFDILLRDLFQRFLVL